MGRRWTINGRFLSQPTTGVQRYAREIVNSLDALIAERAPLARGIEVQHIMSSTRAQPHELTSFARLDGQDVTYPGLI